MATLEINGIVFITAHIPLAIRNAVYQENLEKYGTTAAEKLAKQT